MNSKFQNGGFTLIETIFAISIFTIMMAAATSFFVYLYKEQAADIARIEGISIASKAIEKMSGEIRKMNRAENGTFSLELAQEQTIIFYSDVDNDGLTEKIEYFLEETDLKRRLTEPGESSDYSGMAEISIVAMHVRNGLKPLFAYYNENYTGTEENLADPVNVTEVSVIGISLDINTNESYASSFLHADTKIHPRNLKSFE